MNKTIEKILNEQIVKEAYSSNLYLAMASWAENKGLPGTAQWIYAQAEEERVHLLKFIKYVNERGGTAVIPVIDKPKFAAKNVKDLFKEILKHEEFISTSINEIAAVCVIEKDFATQNWIQWFISEQVEEEASVRAIIDVLNLMGDNNMYLFEKEIVAMRAQAAAADASKA